jgi:hypothetical protein
MKVPSSSGAPSAKLAESAIPWLLGSINGRPFCDGVAVKLLPAVGNKRSSRQKARGR